MYTRNIPVFSENVQCSQFVCLPYLALEVFSQLQCQFLKVWVGEWSITLLEGLLWQFKIFIDTQHPVELILKYNFNKKIRVYNKKHGN